MPTALLACPACRGSLKLSGITVGRKLRCPRCGTVFLPELSSASHSKEHALEDLLSLWQRHDARGQPVSATQLCRDRPELLPELQRRIAALQRLNQLAASGADLPSAGQQTTAPQATPGSEPQTLPPTSAPQTVPTLAPKDANTTAPHGESNGAAASARPVLSGYEIEKELGRGGMGVVYQARDTRLKRRVALKMILAGGHAGQAELARFRTEAEAVARLQHPGIVQIHEVGSHDGLPFFCLEFCPGGSLDRKLKGTPLPPREAAALVQKLAVAMQAAHAKGVIHRDLKPANVLLAEDGTPKITDFGLARKLDEAGQTNTGSVMGTPSYMAPEQAQGSKDIGPACDVYALGAILYELLTGRLPFRAATALDTILQVVSDEPVPPRQLNAQVPRDLETVCLKCLAKEPGRRYASALALAEDLRRFQEGRPIAARPVGRLERTWRWCWRNPTVAGLLALVALTLVTGVIVATGFALRAEAARQGEKQHAEAEGQARREAQQAQRSAHRQLIDLSGASGLTAARNGDHSLALLWYARAVQLAEDEPDLQETNRIRVASWLRRVWLPQAQAVVPHFQRAQHRFQNFQFSPDGHYLLVLTDAGGCMVWDCRQGQSMPLPMGMEHPSAAAWIPRQGLLAVTDKDGRIQLLAPPTFHPVSELQAGGAVSVLACSKDGQRLGWGGAAGARVWDMGKQEYIGPVLHHPRPVVTLSFSASGQLLATSALDGKARVFGVGMDASEPLFPPVPHARPEHGLAHGGQDRAAPRFAADDQVLLTVETAAQGSHLLVWRQARTGRILRYSSPLPGQTFLTAFAVSPEGNQVAVLWEDNGQLWDAREQQFLGTIVPGDHYNWCEDVVFAPSGKTLVTAAHNLKAQFWSVDDRPNGQVAPASPAILQPNKVVRITLTPDGKQMALALWDGTVTMWRVPSGPPLAYTLPAGGTTLPVLSPDGQFVLPGGTTYRFATQMGTRVYHAQTGEAAGPPLNPGGILLNAVFSLDGTQVATASSASGTIVERNKHLFEPDGKGGNVQIWDWKGGKRLTGPIATPTEPRGLAFRPDGKTLAVVCADYRVVLIDPRTGAITHSLDPGVHTRPNNANLWWSNGEARFSSDGRFLVTWEMATCLHVWDPDSGQLLHKLPHQERIESVTFNPLAPAIMASGGRDSVANVWDLASGKRITQLQHPISAQRMGFSPDGNDLVTVCADGMVRVWDWRTGTLKEGLALHPPTLSDLGFTADRRWLVTLDLHHLQVTDWQSKTLAGPLWPLGEKIHLALAMPAGDRRVIVGGFSGSLDAYDLGAMTTRANGEIAELVRLSELAAGRRIMEGGQVVPLDTSEWSERWARLRRAIPGK